MIPMYITQNGLNIGLDFKVEGVETFALRGGVVHCYAMTSPAYLDLCESKKQMFM